MVHPILLALDEYLSRYPNEGEIVETFRTFFVSYPNPFHRECLEGHFTGSAWLSNSEHSKVALMHHKKLNKWLQFGGHADGDDDLLRVAVRETREESGIEEIEPVSPAIFDIDAHEIPARKDVPPHVHYDVRYLLKTTGQETLRQNDESHALKWVSAHEIDSLTTEPSIHRMRQKWLKSLGV